MTVRKEILIINLLVFFCLRLSAQVDQELTKRISSIEESEISDQEKQTLIEDLYYLSINPVNINTAEENTLRIIGLDEFQILSIKRYIKETHPLLSIYEIPLINGFSEETLKQIIHYIYVAPVNWKPSLRLDSISLKSTHDIRLQYKKVLENSWGYRREDDGGYKGTNFSTSLRYNLNYYDRLSFSIVADNDAGEPFFNKKQKLGYDYLSTQLTIKNISIIEQLTIGDYRLGFGEGLAINQNLNFGYFTNDGKSKKNYNGIKPNRSISEYNSMRGIATKIKLKDFSIYLFGSYNKIDYSGSILETGLHRTQSELSKKDSNTEGLFGTHIEWKRRGIELGTTLFHYQYKYPITHQNQAYMQYYFQGKDNNIYSINASFPLLRKSRLFGEMAISKNKGYAYLAGLEINLGYKTNLTINYRNYNKKFQNYYASAIGAQSNTANERGIYSAFSILINNRLNFFIAADYFNFPNQSYRANKSVSGYKIRSELNYTINKYHLFTLLYKQNNRPYNETHANEEVYPEDNILKQIQLRYTFTPNESLMFKTRIGYSQTQIYTSNKNKGAFISQDLIFKKYKFPLSLKLRLAYFNTNDYDNAFYIYEYSLPLTYSSSQLYDKGIRSYIMLNYDFTRDMSLTARYVITYYTNKTFIGSSNDKIEGKKKQEIGVQFYWLINKPKSKKIQLFYN
ncbi:MAG: hypothetical protein WC679_05705 [Bacteroidales bacterium]|jgi:hypothetical protein